jgi:hypothetical protein
VSAAARAQTWARLAASGLVQGEPPVMRLRSPWYVRVMQGGSGWLGALFLLSFVGGLFSLLFRSPEATLVLGVASCGAAILAFRRWPDSDFTGQLAFAVSLAGQAMIGYGLWKLLGERLGVVAAAMGLILAGLFLLAPSTLHRIWTAWSAACCVWLVLFDAELAPLAPGLLAAALAWLWLSDAALARFGERAQAAGWGLALTVAQLAVVMAMLWELRRLVGVAGVPAPYAVVDWVGVGLSAAVLVALAGWLIVREGRSPASGTGLVALVGVAVVALLGVKAPGLAPAMVLLLVGFAAGSRELTGLGVLALLATLSHYYYALHVTLFEKSLLMAAAGGALLLAWLALRRLWPGGGEADLA